MLSHIDAYILAGGRSRRMGRDKSMLEWNGKTLLQALYEDLSGFFGTVYIVAKKDSPAADSGLPLVTDLVDEQCALAGLCSALQHTSRKHIFIRSCDSPVTKLELVNAMAGLSDLHDIVIAKTADGLNPLFGFYSKTCLVPALEALARCDYRITGFFDRMKVRFMEEDEVRAYDPELASFVNINTIEDFESFKAHCS